MCYVILFDFDNNVHVVNVDKLEDLSVVNCALFDATLGKLGHATSSSEAIVGTLSAMADFCSENVQHGCLNGNIDRSSVCKKKCKNSMSSWSM
jgi:hypothetical protein